MIGRLIPGPTGWDRPFVKSEKGAEVQPVIQGPDNNLSFWQEWQDFRLEFPSNPIIPLAPARIVNCLHIPVLCFADWCFRSRIKF